MDDILYYNDQINEELCGAKDYVLKAIKMKESKDHQNWASTYAKMSEAEATHAKNLLDMFDEAFRDDPEANTEMGKAVHSLVSTNYNNKLAQVQKLFEEYQSK